MKNQITNAQASEQVKRELQAQLLVSEEFADKITHSALLLVKQKKYTRKYRNLRDFRLNTAFVTITVADAALIHGLYCYLEQPKSQLMELTGAKVKIVRSRLPGLYGLEGILYQEAPTFIAVIASSGRCYCIEKKSVDWTSDGVYFIGKARSQRYKRLKSYTM